MDTNCTIIAPAEESAFTIPFPGNYILIVILLFLSAMFSGLTLGLLSLDKIGLQIVIGGDDKKAAHYAQAILPVRENGNLLLCTLLLGNVAVNALLSILLADMTSGLVGFLASTVMIVIFGEIIPQASCSRHALMIGYYSLPLVKVFMALLCIIAYPLGYMLDLALGEDMGTIHTKTELRKMLALHVQHGAVDADSGEVLQGALTFRDMVVSEVMTPMPEVFMVCIDDRLDYKVLSDIFRAGCSRVPVFGKDRNEIVGLMLAKDLLFVDPDDEIPIRVFMTHFSRPAMMVWPDQKLGDVLKLFRASRSHMAIVRDVNNEGAGDPFYEVRGIITLEDIMEEILGCEMNDETDDYMEGVEGNSVKPVAVKNRDRDFLRLAMLHGNLHEEKLAPEEIQAISSHLLSNVPIFPKILAAHHAKYISNTVQPSSRGGSSSGLLKGSVKAVMAAAAGLGAGSSTSTPAPTSAVVTAPPPPPVDVEEVQRIISRCKVVELKRASSADEIAAANPKADDFLYKRGEAATSATLILSGKVVILAGSDEFRSEVGPWSVLGMHALYGDTLSAPGITATAYTPDFSAFIVSDTLRCVRLTIGAITPSINRKRTSSGGAYLHGDSVDEEQSVGGASSNGRSSTGTPSVATGTNLAHSHGHGHGHGHGHHSHTHAHGHATAPVPTSAAAQTSNAPLPPPATLPPATAAPAATLPLPVAASTGPGVATAPANANVGIALDAAVARPSQGVELTPAAIPGKQGNGKNKYAPVNGSEENV